MASGLLQWEADPLFPAAEEVQNSADRMMSAFRNWRHATGFGEFFDVSSRTRRAEATTAVNTVKWQIEEFERAVKASATLEQPNFSKDASSRHDIFIQAIRSQVRYVEKILNEAALPNEQQAMHIQSKFEARDSFVDFMSSSTVESDAGSPLGDGTIQGSFSFIATENVKKGSDNCYSPRSKITLGLLSTSADCYPFKEEVKENLIHRQEEKNERTVSLEYSEIFRQKPARLGRASDVNYGHDTYMSSYGPKPLPSSCMSSKEVNGSTEAVQTCHYLNIWEAGKTTGSLPISDSVSKSWKMEVNCMEHLDNVSPFSVIQMLKGASVYDLEQGRRIRPGNHQKVSPGYTSPELETYDKERSNLWRKAVQFRLWMLQQFPFGRTLQLFSVILIVLGFVGITVF